MFQKKKSEEGRALIAPAVGSVQSVARGAGGTALAMLRAKILLICDRSGSMTTADAMHGKQRYEIEDQVVDDLQKKYPGQIIIEAFADSAIICLDGKLPYPDGGATIMSTAFGLAAEVMKSDMRAILITDGEATDSEGEVFTAMRPLVGRLDVVYVGSDHGAGQDFLNRLAKKAAGTFQENTLDSPKLLENTIEMLMLKPGKK